MHLQSSLLFKYFAFALCQIPVKIGRALREFDNLGHFDDKILEDLGSPKQNTKLHEIRSTTAPKSQVSYIMTGTKFDNVVRAQEAAANRRGKTLAKTEKDQ